MRAVTLHRTYGRDPLRRVSALVCAAMGRTSREWCRSGERFPLLRLRENSGASRLGIFARQMGWMVCAMMVLLHASVVRAQSPSFSWANKGGGPEQDYGRGVAIDSAGNVYVAGTFHGASATFGGVTLIGGLSG